jgi:hypothetical protein
MIAAPALVFQITKLVDSPSVVTKSAIRMLHRHSHDLDSFAESWFTGVVQCIQDGRRDMSLCNVFSRYILAQIRDLPGEMSKYLYVEVIFIAVDR